MTQSLNRRAILITSLIWLSVILVAFLAAYLRTSEFKALLPIVGAASLPAVMGIIVSPWADREWSQIFLILVWLSLAIIACVFVGFAPLVALFLAGPVVAALFQQQKVIEALILGSILVVCFYFASLYNVFPESPLSDSQILWAKQAGLMGLISLIIISLFVRGQKDIPGMNANDNGFNPYYESLLGSVMRFDKNGTLLVANSEARATFDIGLAHKDVTLNALIKDKFANSQIIKDSIEKALKAQHVEALNFKSYQGDITQSLDSYIFPQSDGGFVLHALDRTSDEARLESMRQMQTRMSHEAQDKTLFFAGVSHELRTPLNAIIGFSDMMRSRLFGPLPSKYAEYADMIHDSGQHMLDLIGDVLDLSKVQAGKYTLQYDNFDAADVIRSSVKMVRPAADVAEVKFDLDIDEDEELLVEADRKALRQILLNLLSNAIKFSNKGGTVSVSGKVNDGYLRVRVLDQGEGISPEDLIKIGEPYAQSASGLTSDERGSGLGITLVKSLTELHRGEFDIQSAIGEGTDVTVSLPLIRAT